MEAGQQIEVTVSPQGVVTIEAKGFNGCGCTEATAPLEVVLGGAKAKPKRNYKPEFSLPNTAQTKEQW
jgi:hypothetical protein